MAPHRAISFQGGSEGRPDFFLLQIPLAARHFFFFLSPGTRGWVHRHYVHLLPVSRPTFAILQAPDSQAIQGQGLHPHLAHLHLVLRLLSLILHHHLHPHLQLELDGSPNLAPKFGHGT